MLKDERQRRDREPVNIDDLRNPSELLVFIRKTLTEQALTSHKQYGAPDLSGLVDDLVSNFSVTLLHVCFPITSEKAYEGAYASLLTISRQWMEQQGLYGSPLHHMSNFWAGNTNGN